MTMTDMSLITRELALTNWVAQELRVLPDNVRLSSLTGDAGFRRYFRFSSTTPLLAVDAPPHTEDTHQFVMLARYLKAQGVRTPTVVAAHETEGFLLVEDFGDQLLYNTLNRANPRGQYDAALAALITLQRCQDKPALIPRYDRTILHRELELFTEWFATRLLGYSPSPDEHQRLKQTFTLLEDAALAQPQTLVHRDFHSRNLIVCDDGELGVIDFQGALWGAITYDLVSLLRDCYWRLPTEQVHQWARTYHKQAIHAGILPPLPIAQFLHDLDWMGLQRHIKVLGIFARLYLRDGKPGYLKDLPLVIRYTLEIAQSYEALRPFAEWFKAKLLPLAQQQSWYSTYTSAGE